MKNKPRLAMEEFSEKYDKYSPMLYRICILHLGNKQDAEDALQNSFIKLYYKSPEFSDSDAEKAWLIRVTINCSKNILNSKWNRCVDTLEMELKEEEIEMHDIYYEVLRLPQKYRTVIHLFYYENLPIKEISKILNTKETTIKTWLLRGRKKLRNMLEGGEDND